ncbi:nucleoside hydrolase [Candidatus Izimaplasma sp. HR1]|uniref:nucleoside hydrolase n=1 Tax=Candidatus Izimoplasma sp. HR1 TaxID=1541959 RepID=UPI000570ED7A
MKKRKIILDCDPGHDDAIAILLAGKNPIFDLLGITVASGNQTLAKTGRNALNLVQYLELDVPVCLGAVNPIIKEVEVCEAIHGESGLDGFDFPPLEIDFDKRNAMEFMIEEILKSKEKVTMITTGPMTNLGLALRIEPKIIENIEEIVLMGGSYQNGNVTPAAEFNIYCDPEAAYICFNSGVKVTMVGLDVTRKVKVFSHIIDRMEKINNNGSDLFVKLMRVFNENQKKVFGFDGSPLHDPVTIGYLINPDLLEIQHVHCDIDISHGTSYGRTNCDIFDFLELERNTYIAKDIDEEMFWDMIEEALKRY